MRVMLRSSSVTVNMLSGKVCPVCGGHKSSGASCCRKCFLTLGGTPKVRESIEAVVQAVEDAYAGIRAADIGNVARDTAEKPVFTMVRVPKNAEAMKPNPATKGVKDYLKVALPVKGGVVEMFVFSEAGIQNIPLGKTVPGIVSFRVREGKNGPVAYLRVQHVTADVAADSQLLVTSDDKEADRLFRDDLPDVEFAEPCIKRRACVGFKSLSWNETAAAA